MDGRELKPCKANPQVMERPLCPCLLAADVVLLLESEGGGHLLYSQTLSSQALLLGVLPAGHFYQVLVK